MLLETEPSLPDRSGAFVAVVGPSGAGKDSLIAAAATALAADPGFFFPRRVVTRVAVVEAENHETLTSAAFAAAEAAGAFCLTWTAHGHSYGLPAEIPGRLAKGQAVVANLSRAALRDAAERFSRLHVIEIAAQRRLLVERIAARGREAPEEIDLRLQRQVPLQVPESAEGFHRIDNNRRIGEAAAVFLATLERVRAIAANR